jgi:hypothetical protein
MKYWPFTLLIFAAIACNQPPDTDRVLQNRVDTLENELAKAYKPGFGEFMTSIQAHHAKLWWAGQNQNWPLADFEVREIMESVADIQQYETERKESQLIGMIDPAIDSVNSAIQQKNPGLFKSSFVLLTTTCNNCHRAVNFEFNVVKIPDASTFSNQDFRVRAGK